MSSFDKAVQRSAVYIHAVLSIIKSVIPMDKYKLLWGYLNKFFAPGVTGIEFDGSKTFELRTQMRAGRLAYSRWSSYKDGSKDVRAIFAGLLESTS